MRVEPRLLVLGFRSSTGRCCMGLITRFNLAPKLNVAAMCAALVFVGAIVVGVF